MTFDELQQDLHASLAPSARGWLDGACEAVGEDPTAIRTLFPAVGRMVGRHELDTSGEPFAWTADDVARVVLLRCCGGSGEIGELYRFGDAAERRGVLRALPYLPDGDVGMDLVADAIRSNDPRLIAAALSPFALERLDDAAVRQAVLKCVFVGIPLGVLPDLGERADPELSRMLAEYALERVAAGRSVPPDIWPLVDRHPPAAVIERLEAELDSEHDDRRQAAAAALAARAGQEDE